MRIVIDMQGAQTESRFRGIGRYTVALAQGIVRNRGKHEVILALSGLFPDTIEPIRAEFDSLLPQESIRVWHAPGPVREGEAGNTWRRQVAELIREAFLASLKPDVVHISSLFEGYVDDAVTSIGCFDQIVPVSISLYDLIPLLNPNHYLKPNPAYERYYLGKINHLRHASLLLSISESSRQEGLTHLGVLENNVVNISSSADAQFRPVSLDKEQTRALQRKLGLSRPFVLYTGGADERKNLPRLINAYARLSPELRKSHHLVFAGRVHQSELPLLKQAAKSAGLGKNELIFTGYVSDDELVKLYNICKLFVFPSWHEGFGLPVLEAMACGRAVIGSNVSSLPEVIGYNNALFDPFSEQSISNKIAQALVDDTFRIELACHGIERAKQFSWDISAQRAISAMEYLTEKKNKPLISLLYRSVDDITSKLTRKISNTTCHLANEQVLLSLAKAIASSIPHESSKRQLMVDISELVQRDARSGIQRVVRSILHELLYNTPPDFRIEPVYANVDRIGYRYARRFVSQFLNCIDDALVDEPAEFKAGDIFLGLDLQPQVVRAQREFYRELRRNGLQVRFVVYDLLCVLMPHFFVEGAAEEYRGWLEVVGQSNGAICISKAVADDLTTWFEENGREKLCSFSISWFHLGADIQYSLHTLGLPADAARVLEVLQSRISFLMVGTLEPRKGHAQVLGAFEYLWDQGIQVDLVIIGKQGWMVETLIKRLCNHLELGKRLFWLEGISDEYLEEIYKVSTCLIAASEGEGFGLPLIEAAQYKLPIITRDIPVFREVAGDHAFYFSGLEPEDLAEAIRSWLGLYVKGLHPKSDNMPWLTWRESADRLVSLIAASVYP